MSATKTPAEQMVRARKALEIFDRTPPSQYSTELCEMLGECLRAALEQPAGKTSASAFERAMKDSWGMVDPFHPPGTPGSYARGEHNGIVAALRTVRMNYERHAAPATQQQDTPK